MYLTLSYSTATNVEKKFAEVQTQEFLFFQAT